MFLDIIHHPVFIQKHRPLYFSKHNISDTGYCLRLQVNLLSWVQSIELVPISGHLCEFQYGVYKRNTAQTICES
jgi:hypothetical protein